MVVLVHKLARSLKLFDYRCTVANLIRERIPSCCYKMFTDRRSKYHVYISQKNLDMNL
jgi:hypothetical protein